MGSDRGSRFLRLKTGQGGQLHDSERFVQEQRTDRRLSSGSKFGGIDESQYPTADIFERVWAERRWRGHQARLSERSSVVHGSGIPRIRVSIDYLFPNIQ